MKEIILGSVAGFEIGITRKSRENFTVRYGKHITRRLTYSQAAAEIGAAFLHGVACNDWQTDSTIRKEEEK